MKKNAIKITLFVLCVAVTIFLLLPFFERSNSNTASLNVKAEPQIFTSNPLTALMNRLASLFGRPIKEKPSTVLTNQQVDQMFGTQVPSPQTAGVNPSSALQNSSQPSPESSSWEQPTRVDMSDALVLNEEGNWVLARQVYPESSPQGMHEINIKDNPYDTYIRQQKAAQYNPALEQPGISTPTSQSESYWHKLITPIKHFFGFDEAKAVTPGQFQQMAGAGSPNATALVTNPVNDANLNQSRANASGEKISSPDFSLDASSWLSTPEGKIQQQMRDLYSRLNPESFLEHAVDALANSKFKEPLTEKQRQQKEEFVKETKQNLSEKLKEWQRARMDKISTNRSIVEHFEGACYNKSLPNTQSCFRTEIIPPTDQEIVQNTQQTNQQNFQNITHMPLPHIPFTPVLGIADKPISLRNGENSFDAPYDVIPGLMVTDEIYKWQFEHHNCHKQKDSCIYVANEIQKDPGQADAVRMANGFFVGDPEHVYLQDKPAFINYRLSHAPKGASEEERQKIAAQAAEDYERFAPPLIVYTAETGAKYQQKVDQVMRDPNSTEKVSFWLMLNGSQASPLQEEIGSTTFFYDSRSTILEKDNVSAQKVSQNVVQSSAELVQETFEYAKQLAEELNQETIKNNLGDTNEFYNRSLTENGGDALQTFRTIFSAPSSSDKK